jgi:hypothetical protein
VRWGAIYMGFVDRRGFRFVDKIEEKGLRSVTTLVFLAGSPVCRKCGASVVSNSEPGQRRQH